MAQVKFYSMSALPASASNDGVYFIQGGELYKGSQRFGLGRVTVDAAFVPSTSSKAGQAKGDIVVTGSGAGWVFDGTNWQSIGGDITSLQSMWRADISTWTAGLVQSGTGSYITGITQDEDGKVTASASNFALDVKNAIGDGAASSTANGITVSVTTTSGSVTGVEVSASQITCDSVSAATGTFTTLSVSTANFDVTNVSTTSLTINGSTVEQLADKQIAAIAASTVTSTSNGITVGVTTQGGSVTAVSMDASSFGNVMRFRGVVTSTSDVTDPTAGDIVVIGSAPSGGAVAGQEYIYTEDESWELIGDQNTYALNAYTSGASVYTGVTTVPGALNAAGAAIDALNAVSATRASVGTSTTEATHGVSAAITLANNAEPTLSITVDAITASTDIETGVDKVVTAGAVADYVTSKVAYVPAQGETVTAGTTTLDGAVHAIAGAVDTINTNIATKASVGTSTSTHAGITGAVTLSATAAPSITMTVDVSTLQSALGLKDAAYRDVSTTVSDTTSTALVTEGAVATALTWLTA